MIDLYDYEGWNVWWEIESGDSCVDILPPHCKGVPMTLEDYTYRRWLVGKLNAMFYEREGSV